MVSISALTRFVPRLACLYCKSVRVRTRLCVCVCVCVFRCCGVQEPEALLSLATSNQLHHLLCSARRPARHQEGGGGNRDVRRQHHHPGPPQAARHCHPRPHVRAARRRHGRAAAVGQQAGAARQGGQRAPGGFSGGATPNDAAAATPTAAPAARAQAGAAAEPGAAARAIGSARAKTATPRRWHSQRGRSAAAGRRCPPAATPGPLARPVRAGFEPHGGGRARNDRAQRPGFVWGGGRALLWPSLLTNNTLARRFASPLSPHAKANRARRAA